MKSNFSCKNNYNIPKLFQNYLPYQSHWQQLPEDLIEKYSPPYSQSMDISIIKHYNNLNVNAETYQWTKIELFESFLSDTTLSIFCGGPISALSWLPTPHDENVEQILAVAISLDFNKKYYVHQKDVDGAIIQFWNFGVLDNQNFLGNQPKLDFCLCGDFGCITHMEWCPSGCYDVDDDNNSTLQRLGLLAVASSDTNVYIFSIPKPSSLM